ncbi:MAG: U32 family peptidase, partial [Coriobacteriia bacterium]|nr:U32 family peptidase [Coriobacteriia bacterium]
MELLAPAGSKEAFYAALGSGARAIYLGVETLNARRLAANIKQTELAGLTRLAHLFDCKVYLTLNTIILQEEYDQAIQLAADSWADGVDAIIVQDFGLLTCLRKHLPQLRIHASTQMNVHSSDTLRALAQLGVARVTLSRELSLEQIEVLAAVGREQGVEVEVFGHGALCVCYSGQCLFSSLVGRRSANRGLCAQPCRLPYELIDHRGTLHQTAGPYLLSPKDLCAIDYLPRIHAAGVTSLKIEGRMKKPSYVAAVVSSYRTALDAIEQAAEAEAEEQSPSPADTTLVDAFNRALTAGYLQAQQGGDFMDYLRIKNPTTAAAQQLLADRAADASARVQDFRQLLDFSAHIVVGEPLVVAVSDAQGNGGRFEGEAVQTARTKPLTADEVRVHLGRLGNTPYGMGTLDLQLDAQAGMGFSTLHQARRAAIANYEDQRFFAGKASLRTAEALKAAQKQALRDNLPQRKLKRDLNPDIVAVVGSLSAARAVLNAGATQAQMNAWLLAEVSVEDLLPADADQHIRPEIVPILPRIAADSELDTYYGIAERFGAAVCSTLGQLATCLQRGIPAQAHWSL